METFYWFRDGEFGEVQAYTLNEAVNAIGVGKLIYDPTDEDDHFFWKDIEKGSGFIPRWLVPKEFLVKLMLLGVPL